MVSFIILGASGCGTQVPLYRAAANASANSAAFQGSGVNPGVILPWYNRVYELVDTVNTDQAAPILGHMSYYFAKQITESYSKPSEPNLLAAHHSGRELALDLFHRLRRNLIA